MSKEGETRLLVVMHVNGLSKNHKARRTSLCLEGDFPVSSSASAKDVERRARKKTDGTLTSAFATSSGLLIHSTSHPHFSMALTRERILPAT